MTKKRLSLLIVLILVNLIIGCNVPIAPSSNIDKAQSIPISDNNLQTHSLTETNEVTSQIEPIDECKSKSINEQIYCYGNKAKSEERPEWCDKITSNLAKNECVYHFIRMHDDQGFINEKIKHIDFMALCNNLVEEKKNFCYSMIGRRAIDVRGCYALPEESIDRKTCLNNFLIIVKDEKLKEIGISFCSKLKKYDSLSVECLDRFAKIDDNPNLCQTDECIKEFAKKKLDVAICDKLICDGYANASDCINLCRDDCINPCKDDIAVQLGNPDLCQTDECRAYIAYDKNDVNICHQHPSQVCYTYVFSAAASAGLHRIDIDQDVNEKDCEIMKENCADCSGDYSYLYEYCLIDALSHNPDFKEEDCGIIEDATLKEECIHESWN